MAKATTPRSWNCTWGRATRRVSYCVGHVERTSPRPRQAARAARYRVRAAFTSFMGTMAWTARSVAARSRATQASMLTPSAPPSAAAAARGPALSAIAEMGAKPSVGENPETDGATTTAVSACLSASTCSHTTPEHEERPAGHDEHGHVVGSRRLQVHGRLLADDALPRAGRGQQDDDTHGEQAAEQEGGPRVESPQRCAQPVHFTGLHEAARPRMRSFESWLSSVLITQ